MLHSTVMVLEQCYISAVLLPFKSETYCSTTTTDLLKSGRPQTLSQQGNQLLLQGLWKGSGFLLKLRPLQQNLLSSCHSELSLC